MAKLQLVYTCAACSAQFPKWSGRCLECGAWGTLAEDVTPKNNNQDNINQKISAAATVDWDKLNQNTAPKIKINISEIDRVLGSGLTPGSLILLSGEPGIGKSTLVAQIASAVGTPNKPVVYASGEESAPQIKERLNRINCDLGKIKLINETHIEKIIAAGKELRPLLMIIDSIQTVYTSDIEAEAGGMAQIRASTIKLLELAKKENIAVIIIGHITKDGSIAGPKSLEHIVDTVIHFENDNGDNYSILRASKNRFGSTNELGILEMTAHGFVEIKNPAAVFLEDSHEKLSGSVISCVLEGTRPFMIEIQALATKTVFGYPQRKANGIDLNRLQVLAAVISKRTKINLINQDIILNIVGGVKVNDPSTDLAICLAIASSLLNQTLPRQTIVLGEVGLNGEVRKIKKLEEKLAEAAQLGFKEAIIPFYQAKAPQQKIKLTMVKNISEAINNLVK